MSTTALQLTEDQAEGRRVALMKRIAANEKKLEKCRRDLDLLADELQADRDTLVQLSAIPRGLMRIVGEPDDGVRRPARPRHKPPFGPAISLPDLVAAAPEQETSEQEASDAKLERVAL